jgi:CBS-domain-containing membrane protein
MPISKYIKTVRQMLTPEMRLYQAWPLIKNSDYDAIPLGEKDRLVGVLTIDDLNAAADCADLTVAQVMQWRFYCYTDDKPERPIAVIRDRRVTSLPVMDDSRRVLGMIRLKDLMKDKTRRPFQTPAPLPELVMSA